MYGKLFESIYDGTLVEDWRALITFQQMIILCDSDGILDMTPSAMARRTGIPLEHIKDGIEILESNDDHSRTPDEKGRRIVRLDDHREWGWRIVNHKHYRDLRTANDKRTYMRKYMQDKRAREKLTKTNETLQVSNVDHADTNTNTNTNIKPSSSKNKFSDDDLAFAQYMGEKLVEIMPNMKKPNLESWANEIRLMTERDNRTLEEIRSVFDWANNDSFWRTNILSPSKLRKQFDKLQLKLNEGLNNGTNQQNNKTSLGQRATETRREFEQQDIN